MDPNKPRVARAAWLSDIQLMRSPRRVLYKKCWTYMLLHTLQGIGVLSESEWVPSSIDLTKLSISEDVVKSKLATCLRARWESVRDVVVCPRVAPSVGVDLCTHTSWVYPFDHAVDYTSHKSAPKYMFLCLPFRYLCVLAQLRLGWAHLEVQQGRRQHIAREQRLCKLCCRGGRGQAGWHQQTLARTGAATDADGVVEDLRHLILECPAYDDVRAVYKLLPEQPWCVSDAGFIMRAMFACDDQSKLARMLFDMKAKRASLLGLCRL
jgi:hypothetical protein